MHHLGVLRVCLQTEKAQNAYVHYCPVGVALNISQKSSLKKDIPKIIICNPRPSEAKNVPAILEAEILGKHGATY